MVQESVKPKSKHVYRTVDDLDLELYMDFPEDWRPSDKRPFIVFFHGGGGTARQFEKIGKYFASRGLVCARVEYRGRNRGNPEPGGDVKDGRSSIRWLKKNAEMFGIDPDRLIASGGSAGGHVAACTAITNGVDAEEDDLSISVIPKAMVLFNSPLAQREGRARTAGDADARSAGDEEIRRKTTPNLHLHKDQPPAILFYGTEDRLMSDGEEYRAIAKELGIVAEWFIAEGVGHSFFNRSPWRERTFIAADKFLTKLSSLKGEPTIKVPKEKELRKPQGDFIAARASSVHSVNIPGSAVDGRDSTRWETARRVDSQWLEVELKEVQELRSIIISWETATRWKYEVLVSKDGQSWISVASILDGEKSAKRTLVFDPVEAKFIKISGKTLVTQRLGCSIYEIAVK